MDSRHNHTLIISSQTLNQIMGIVRFINIYDIISGVGKEGRRRLLVKVPTVHNENRLLNSWNLQEVASYLVGG